MRERLSMRSVWVWVAAFSAALTAPATASVTGLSVQDSANAADWSVQSNLQSGNSQYGDRAFTFTTVPAVVAGSEWIRTANDSKAFTGATLVTFTVTVDSDVYVAHNDSIGTKPSWLSAANGWTDSGANLVNSEPRTFSLFRKSFAGGSMVSLGNNGNTTSGMYTIVVKETGIAIPTATPTSTPIVTPTPTPTGPPPPDMKLSVVSVTASTQDGNVAANSIDGNLTTRWSGNGDGATLTLDLGSLQTVTFVKVAVFSGNTRANKFDIQVSDGVGPFNTVRSGIQSSGTTTALESYDIPDQPARLVRYLGHGNTDPTKATWNSVSEVEVWGNPCNSCPTPTITPTPTQGPTPTPTPTSNGQPNGNPVLPPKWAFGVLYGSYHNQSQVLSDMQQLRASYSGDMYWIDSSWLSNSYTGQPERYICFEFDPTQFPDAPNMIQQLRDNHFHFGVWQWPWVDQGCKSFNFGKNNHLFVENSSGNVVDGGGWHGNDFTGAFDYTNPATITWWNQLNTPIVNMGVGFWKLDTGGGFPSGGELHDGSNSQDKYKTLYRKTAWDRSAIVNGGRGIVLTHTQKSTGADQYPGMWTGDTSASFSGLVSEMGKAAALNTSNSTAFWCGDTGGYNNTPNSELYIRWLEYTAFTPCQEFFGAKTTSTGARFPWMFSTQAQQIFKTYTALRYRLLPFRYSNAQITYHVKPVQYFVRWIGTKQIVNGSGDSQILAQPITSAGATSASVALPSGSWIDYWTGTVYAGGATHTIPAAIDRMPLLVKAGSIIPMGPDLRWVDEKPADPLTLDIYPSGSTSYTLYEDDGVTRNYQGGAFSTTRYASNATASGVTVSIGASSGDYAGKLADRTYILKINKQASDPGNVMRDGSALTRQASRVDFDAASEGWFYDAAADIVWAKFRISTSTATSVSY
jgi:hypothetical protein